MDEDYSGHGMLRPHNLIREQYKAQSSPPSSLIYSLTHSYGCWMQQE